MFNIFKTTQRNKDIDNALAYLIESHKGHNTGDGEFVYVKTVEKGNFRRFYFLKGNKTKLIYVALSPQERNKIIQTFHQKMGDGYAYLDSVISSKLGPEVQHRFTFKNGFDTSFTFMDDAGYIWGGHFSIY